MTVPVRGPYHDLDGAVSRAVLAELDEAAPCAEHWKILITAGMGFFADAYDMFIIGVAATLITAEWHIASCIADKLGRRKVYGYEVLRPHP